jgi:hypothetical protein
MHAHDWQRLGLAATTDVAAIKRAYAIKLRSTRPDDDAQAYQQLRESYDRALWWARHAEALLEEATSVMAALDAPSGPMPLEAPPPAAPPACPPARPPAATQDAPPPATLPHAAPPAAPGSVALQSLQAAAPDVHPEALCRQALELWHRRGSAALMAWLPALKQALHRLPLHLDAEASARFADLVIAVPQLPEPFVRELQLHFGWLADFRGARALGAARAQALQEALANVTLRVVTDPRTLRVHAEVLALHRLLQARLLLRAWLYASLVGVAIMHRMTLSGGALLRRLGVDAHAHHALTGALTKGQWIRTVAVTVGVYCAGRLGGAGMEQAILGVAGTLLLGFVAGMLLLVVLIYLSKLRAGLVLPPRWARRVRAWPGLHHAPWLGLAAVLAGAGLFALAALHGSPWAFVAAVLLCFMGTLAALPRMLDQAMIVGALWALAVAALDGMAGFSGAGPVVFALAGTWSLAGSLLYEQGLPQRAWHAAAARGRSPPVARGRSRPVLRLWLPAAAAALLLAVPLLPALALYLAEVFGFRLVLTAVLLVVSLPLMQVASLQHPVMWLAVPAAMLLLAGAQVLAHRVASQLVPDATHNA